MPSWLSTPAMRASRARSTASASSSLNGRRLDGIFLDRPQVGILDGEGRPVGHDAQRARRRVIEPDLARPLHIEAPRGALVGGIDLLEAALQIGDVVEIGVDALDGLGLRLADQRRRGLRRLDGGLPAGALVDGGRGDLIVRSRRAGRPGLIAKRGPELILRLGQALRRGDRPSAMAGPLDRRWSPPSWAAAGPIESHKAMGNAKDSPAALRLVINPPPLTG